MRGMLGLGESQCEPSTEHLLHPVSTIKSALHVIAMIIVLAWNDSLFLLAPGSRGLQRYPRCIEAFSCFENVGVG